MLPFPLLSANAGRFPFLSRRCQETRLALKTRVTLSMFTSPASSSLAAFGITEEKVQGKSGSAATALGPRAALDLCDCGHCAGAGMKVVLQRVRR